MDITVIFTPVPRMIGCLDRFLSWDIPPDNISGLLWKELKKI